MSGTVTILPVDGGKVDAMADKRCFRELKIANPSIAARNGIGRNDQLPQSTLVIALTTSGVEEDRRQACSKNIAGFLPKQRTGRSFVQAIRMLEHFWRLIGFPA